MVPSQPIVPLCVTTDTLGNIYAATFTYWQAVIGTSPYPDFFVVMKGSSIEGGQISDSQWGAVAAIERTTTNIFPDQQYLYSCAVSPDRTAFILVVQLQNYWSSQLFSIQVLISENMNWYQQILLTVDNSWDGPNLDIFKSMSALTSIQNLAWTNGVPNATESATGQQPYGDWFLAFQDVINNANNFWYSRSINGSFPTASTPDYSVQEGPDNDPYDPLDPSNPHYVTLLPCSVAIGKDVYYSLTTMNSIPPVLTLSSVPLTLNTTTPSTLATLLPSDKKTWAFPPNLRCLDGTVAMAADSSNNSVVYVICSTQVTTTSPTLVRIDTSTNTTEYISLTMVGSAAMITWTVRNCNYCGPLSLVSRGQNLLIYHDSSLDPNPLFFINLVTAQMGPMAIDGIPYFSGNNPNRFLAPTTLSMTLPTWNSIGITLGAIFFGLILIWGQDIVEKWRTHRWVDNRDIPGSKVADEVDEATFQEYQRAHRENMTRHLQNVDQIEQEEAPRAPQSHFAGSRSNGDSRDSLPNDPVSGETDAVDLSDRSSPFLLEHDFDFLQFSSHPRPNVVTIITDTLSA